jgi:hypothetical protein
VRSWSSADGAWYVPQLGDSEIQRFTSERADAMIEDFRLALDELGQRDDLAGFAIIDPATRELAGNLAASLLDRPKSPPPGLATAALNQMHQWIAANWPGLRPGPEHRCRQPAVTTRRRRTRLPARPRTGPSRRAHVAGPVRRRRRAGGAEDHALTMRRVQLRRGHELAPGGPGTSGTPARRWPTSEGTRSFACRDMCSRPIAARRTRSMLVPRARASRCPPLG